MKVDDSGIVDLVFYGLFFVSQERSVVLCKDRPTKKKKKSKSYDIQICPFSTVSSVVRTIVVFHPTRSKDGIVVLKCPLPFKPESQS